MFFIQDLYNAVMVFSHVTQVINYLGAIIQYVFVVASFTGELIVSLVIWLLCVIVNICDNILTFFGVVYEDNTSIFTAIPNSGKEILEIISYQIQSVPDVFEDFSQYIFEKTIAVLSYIAWLVYTVVTVSSEVCILLIKSLVFFGQSVWFLVTFLPVHFPFLVKVIICSIYNIIAKTVVNGYMRLLMFTNYLTEVPFESFLGLLFSIIIVRLFVHFKEPMITIFSKIFWYVTRHILLVYHALLNYWLNPEVRMITGVISGEIRNVREDNLDEVRHPRPTEYSSHTRPTEYQTTHTQLPILTDAFCVVCQENQKCVLTLPCKHICLCTDCCRRLYNYQRTCPICRRYIYHSVSVYW